MTVCSVIFLIPWVLVMRATMLEVDHQGNPVEFHMFMAIAMPLFYLVFGYISVVIGAAIYNLIFKFVGGIEFNYENQGNG